MVTGVAGGIFYLFCGILVIDADRKAVRRSRWQYPFVAVFWWYFLYRGLINCGRFKLPK
jgi:hypothetical protein